jgi:hypothetical protein
MRFKCLWYECPSTFKDAEELKEHVKERHMKIYNYLYEGIDGDEDDEDDEDGESPLHNARCTGTRILVHAIRILGNGSSSIAPQFTLFVVLVVILMSISKRWK